MISFVTLFVAACQQPSFERKVFKSSPTKKLDDTKFCVYEGKEYSKGSVIKAEMYLIKRYLGENSYLNFNV